MSDDRQKTPDDMARPPSVDFLARSLRDTGLPHPLLVQIARKAIAAGNVEDTKRYAFDLGRSFLHPVINATGVLLHTNLGRAPVHRADSDGAVRYSNLEFDLVDGRRGSRQRSISQLLQPLCGAESALIVNNGAAGVLLVAAALSSGREAIVSRGELVEIGGGFRIPDVLASSGARLIEVGTTNKTRIADYASAIGEQSAVIFKIHQSNFVISGFTESVDVTELAKLHPLLVVDLGSGLLDASCPWLNSGPPTWLIGEPAVRQTIDAGADLVIFSGDKLLGGPQAGIIVGRSDLVARLARHPLARALRPGSQTLVDLQATLLSFLERDISRLPLWEMATRSVEELKVRAHSLGAGEPTALSSVMGGGALPNAEIASYGVRVRGDHALSLRHGTPPIVARVHEGWTSLDLRTVDPADDKVLAEALASCM